MEKINFEREECVRRVIEECQSLIRREAEDFLRRIIKDEYEKRSKSYWKRDYSSIENYLNSIKRARKDWLECLGDFSEYYSDKFNPETEKIYEDEKEEIFYISIEIYKGMRGYALLGYPKNIKKTAPLIITQHGVSSSPFHIFDFCAPGGVYHAVGRILIEEGYIVLAPFNITETIREGYVILSSECGPRTRIQRLCVLLKKTIAGLEAGKYKRWIDYFSLDKRVDIDKVGMWGLSLGGYYTLITMPIEERIKIGICSAFFNQRIEKMIIDDPRYSCFLSTKEEHIFIPGWLTYFSDYDLVSLICPRPFMIQAGKQDVISWYPFLIKEYEKSKEHYEKLGIEEKIVLDLHSGGHEIRVDTGISFLKKFLV